MFLFRGVKVVEKGEKSQGWRIKQLIQYLSLEDAIIRIDVIGTPTALLNKSLKKAGIMRLVSKWTGQTAQIIYIIQKINSFIIEWLKTFLNSFIPRIQKKPAGLRPQQTIEIVFEYVVSKKKVLSLCCVFGEKLYLCHPIII